MSTSVFRGDYHICLVITIALVPYLIVNLNIPPFKRKIFLGDAGSMFLGFIIGYLVLFGSQHNELEPAFRPVTALWQFGLFGQNTEEHNTKVGNNNQQ
ncbi:hypothetical protein [Aeromonas caviae]|uniref:hypothetical protein n=1 Tax=Aeromonas caviae TaxID=648 RepID=UPI00210B6449|nr:hypothetical protein [Aeromonas caviae]